MDPAVKKQYDTDTKYCLLCKKNETREECAWGPKMWDKYTTGKLDIGEEKDHEVAMAQSQLSSAAKDIKTLQKRLGKKEKNIPAWMQAKITDTEHNMDAAAGYTKKEEFVSEKKRGLWDNIHAKRKRGERPSKPGEEGYPKTLNVESKKVTCEECDGKGCSHCDDKGYHFKEGVGISIAHAIDRTKPPVGSKRRAISGALKMREIEKTVARNKKKSFTNAGAGRTTAKEGISYSQFMTEAAAWTRKAGKNPSGGLNEKGRKSYERENRGSDLKAPSKKVGNPRRASFCARMKGMKKKLTSKKTASDPDSRINKSLRAWNC